MEYIDISPLISEKLAVFPGDTNFSQEVVLDFKQSNLFLSTIHTTTHLGAHVDAPNHYHFDGCDISERNLDYYLGFCQVISVNVSSGSRIFPHDIENVSIKAPRVLFKTNSFLNPNKWHENFTALSPELIEYLVTQKVILVGIDTPSIDPFVSEELEAHQAVYKNDLAILEGIILEHVQDGIYTLIALPLKIKGGDASPVRAILLKNKIT